MTELQFMLSELKRKQTELEKFELALSKDKDFIQNLFQPVFPTDLFAKDIDSIEWVISDDLRYLFAEQDKWSEWQEGELIFVFKLSGKRGKTYQVTFYFLKDRILIAEEKNSLIEEFKFGEGGSAVYCFDDYGNPILTPELKEYLEKQSRAVRIGIMLFLNSCRQD